MRHALRMRYIVICGLLGHTIFFHKIFEKKVTEQKMRVLIFSTTFV
jgi:hypothetical protein